MLRVLTVSFATVPSETAQWLLRWTLVGATVCALVPLDLALIALSQLLRIASRLRARAAGDAGGFDDALCREV